VTYSAVQEDEEFSNLVHDVIRWRYIKDKDGEFQRDDDDGKLLRESNARLIEWEDGSYTLHIGKEAFEVDNVDSSRKINAPDGSGRTFSFAGLNGYLYLSQIATNRERKKEDKKEADEEKEANKNESKDGGDNDEKDKQQDTDADTDAPKKPVEYQETPAGTVLECIGSIRSRLTARPLLKSEAHKSLTVAVRQKTIKRATIAEHVTQEDPEARKEAQIKIKDQAAKEEAKKKSYGDGYSRNYNRATPRSRPGMNRGYLEDDGDFDTTDIRAMKKRTMNADDDDMMDDYGDDDESDSEEEATFNRRSAKRSNALDDSEDDSDVPKEKGDTEVAENDNNDDDEDDGVIAPVKTKKRKTQSVFDDDDDDDESV